MIVKADYERDTLADFIKTDVDNDSEIYIASGDYKLSKTIEISGKNSLKIYGGFIGNETAIDLSKRDFTKHTTILDGQNQHGVISFDISNANSQDFIIDGFVIQNGSADSGGGLFIQNGTPAVKNSVFKNNKATGTSGIGGGAFFYEFNGTFGNQYRFTNCTFTNNTAKQGGGMYACGDTINPLELINCTLSGDVYNETQPYGNTGTYRLYATNTIFKGTVTGDYVSFDHCAVPTGTNLTNITHNDADTVYLPSDWNTINFFGNIEKCNFFKNNF